MVLTSAMRQIGFVRSVIRRFSNNNGDGNENVKKAIGILSKTTTRASYFFQHFFAVTARLLRENA